MSTPVPTRTDDLLGITLTHRAMCADARRLADLAARIVAGEERVDRARGVALARWIGRVADEIHHHHEAEDDVLWPVLERWAGARVDLSALTDDHAALDSLLAEVRAVAGEVAALPAEDVAGSPAAVALARRLGALADLLAEHVAEEERDLFPIILAHVPQAEWHAVEAAVRDRGGDMPFALPRIAAAASPEQLADLRRAAGPVLSVLLPITRWRLRRAEKLVFGSATL